MFGMPSTTATFGTGLSVLAAAHATSPRDAHAMYSELFASRTRQTSPIPSSRSKTSLLSKITSQVNDFRRSVYSSFLCLDGLDPTIRGLRSTTQSPQPAQVAHHSATQPCVCDASSASHSWSCSLDDDHASGIPAHDRGA